MNNNVDFAKIEIRGLKCFAYHGVLPQEKENGQDFFVDAEVIFDAKQYITDDNLNSTLNYVILCDIIKSEFCLTKYDLIETAAYKCCEKVLEEFKIADSIKITVHKPHAPIPDTEFDDVAVTMQINRKKD